MNYMMLTGGYLLFDSSRPPVINLMSCKIMIKKRGVGPKVHSLGPEILLVYICVLGPYEMK